MNGAKQWNRPKTNNDVQKYIKLSITTKKIVLQKIEEFTHNCMVFNNNKKNRTGYLSIPNLINWANC